jgi:hypothetical protein
MDDTQEQLQCERGNNNNKIPFALFAPGAAHQCQRRLLIYILHLPLSSGLTGVLQTESVSHLMERGTPVLRFLSFLYEDTYIKWGSLYSVSREGGPSS